LKKFNFRGIFFVKEKKQFKVVPRGGKRHFCSASSGKNDAAKLRQDGMTQASALVGIASYSPYFTSKSILNTFIQIKNN
jgi:hypothetical protein